MVDLRENKFLVLDGEFECGSLIILSAHKTKVDALEAMKEKISKSNASYLIVEIEELSDDYRKSFQHECDIEIAIRENRIKILQDEISNLKKRKERSALNGCKNG